MFFFLNLEIPRCNFFLKLWNHERHPTDCPGRLAMGFLPWKFFGEKTVIWRYQEHIASPRDQRVKSGQCPIVGPCPSRRFLCAAYWMVIHYSQLPASLWLVTDVIEAGAPCPLYIYMKRESHEHSVHNSVLLCHWALPTLLAFCEVKMPFRYLYLIKGQ